MGEEKGYLSELENSFMSILEELEKATLANQFFIQT